MQVLSLNKINKQIKDKIILKDISLTLEEGKILGLLGPNGAGKTSMMKIISGLSRANSGKLEILGIEVDKERAKIKSQLGFVMQDNNMEREFSVKEALLYYARLYKVKNYKYEVKKIISQFEMNTWQDRKIEKLSGGMARKAMIARALLVKPKILLLDEPSVGLDPDVRYDIWQEIKKLKNMGISVIITTHYMEEAEYLCDKIAILKQGELLAIDEVEKIKQIMQKDENEDIDSNMLDELFCNFIQEVLDTYGMAVRHGDYVEYCNVESVYYDNAETVLGNSIRNAVEKRFPWIIVRKAKKVTIIDRIRCTVKLMGARRFWLTKNCKSLETAFSDAVWDKEAKGRDERLDDGSTDIDSLDAFEYTIERDMRELIQEAEDV